jgi:hypothetical protein
VVQGYRTITGLVQWYRCSTRVQEYYMCTKPIGVVQGYRGRGAVQV